MSGFAIRPLRTHHDYRACIALQEATWGEGFSERVPGALMQVSQRLGGVAAGIFDEAGTLAGFVFGVTGLEDGVPVHWSDMLAVRPEHQGRGLGMRLKRYQREVVLALGVRRMYWTFDPLESRNAYLNLARLGAVAREYVENMYGHTDSPLHDGIGTDRLVALWQLDTDRVTRRLSRRVEPAAERVADVPCVLGWKAGEAGGWPEPDIRTAPSARRALAAVPVDIQALKRSAPKLASAWRNATRSVFRRYLARGYEAREFIRGARVSYYLLAKLPRDEVPEPHA